MCLISLTFEIEFAERYSRRRFYKFSSPFSLNIRKYDSLSQLVLAQIEDPQFGEVVQAGNRDQLVAVQVELGEVQALDPGDGRDVVV